MQKSIMYAILAAAIIAVAGICIYALTNNGGGGGNESHDEPLKDFSGYEVRAVNDLSRGIVAVGQDSFRWVTYFGLADKCVMVDMNDKTNYLGKAFMYQGKAQALNGAKPISGQDLAFTTANCSVTDEDVKTILDLNPSVVVVPEGFESDCKKQMDALRAGGLHIVHIGYIYTFLDANTFKITESVEKQLDILAKTFNAQKRADEIRSAFKTTVDDIRSIASRVTTKKTGYIGCLAYNGAHGADSSIPYFMPFALANVTNIMSGDTMDYVDSGVKVYSADVISQKMSSDTILFLDATGIYKTDDNTSIGILKLFAGHEAYIAYPYIWTGINYENVLACAYQILHDAYGLLTDAELENKINDLNKKFLGSQTSNRSELTSKNVPLPDGDSIYDDMSAVFEAFRGNATHGRISISDDGAISFIENEESSDLRLPSYVPDTKGQTFVDAAGRTVTVPDQLGNGIVTIGGTGPLRFLSMFGMNGYVIETDKGDVTDNKNGRAYSYAYPYDQLTSYHADNAIDAALVEKLGKDRPSLVITSLSLYSSNTDLFSSLAKMTTLIVLENQRMDTMGDAESGVAEFFRNNVEWLGKAFGKVDRASELISGVESVIKELSSLKGNGDSKVYVAGVTISGSNTLNTTFPVYMPFDLTGTANAYNLGSTANKVVLKEEEIAKLDIDMIIIDPSSSDKVSQPESQYFLRYVSIINGDSDPSNDIPLYVTVPIVWDSINYDCALASAYYVAHLVHGTLTLEQVEGKINDIFVLFYGDEGNHVFSDMKAFFAGKSSANGVEFPILGEAKVVKNGSEYTIAAA